MTRMEQGRRVLRREQPALLALFVLSLTLSTFTGLAGTIVLKEAKVELATLLELYKGEVLKREKTTKFVFERPHLNFYLISNYFGQNIWKDGDVRVELGSYSISGKVDNRNVCSELIINSQYNETDEEYNYVKNFIAQRLPDILKDARSEVEKVWALNEWIKSWVDYDWSYKRTTSYQALVDRTVVCNGYAMLFYRMAKAVGIEVKFITGTVRGTRVAGRHAWNAVKINNLWYFVDVTWNDVENSGNLYLLSSLKDMSVSHRIEYETPRPLADEHYFDVLYKRVVNDKDKDAFNSIEKLYGHKLGFSRDVLYNTVVEALERGSSSVFYDFNSFSRDLESVLGELFESYTWSATRLPFKKTSGKDLWIYVLKVTGKPKVRDLAPRSIFGG